MKKNLAEFIGTFWLVLGGCGSAMLAAGFPEVGIGLVGVSFAFGLTVLTIAYSLGHISGAHLNPAVTSGLYMGGRISAKEILPYVVSQVLGGIAAAAVLYLIATGNGSEIGSFAANGYGEHSPGNYSLLAAIVTELVMTYVFAHHPGCHRRESAQRFCRISHWSGIDPDSPHQHPRNQHFGKPGPQHQPGIVCGRLGTGPAMAICFNPCCGGHAGRLGL